MNHFARMIVRMFVNQGVNAGINRAFGQKAKRDMTPAERRQAQASAKTSRRARQAIKIARRMGRF